MQCGSLVFVQHFTDVYCRTPSANILNILSFVMQGVNRLKEYAVKATSKLQPSIVKLSENLAVLFLGV